MLEHVFNFKSVRDKIATTYRTHIQDAETRRALEYAKFAHFDQRRKYTGDPYIVHPIMVAQLVCAANPTPEMVRAAFLHDTVEDTLVTLTDITREFGPEVAAIVDELTDHEWPHPRPNRKTRKAHDAKRLAAASYEAQTVKYADYIANGYDIVEHDQNFAKVYLGEIAASLKNMTNGHAGMRAYAVAMIANKKRELNNE